MRRYRLKIATWTVIREKDEPCLRKLDSPESAATLAPRVDVVPVDGADHGFSRHQADLLEALARWLDDVFKR